jgi:uncharacterized membrane protein YkvA (DUF1232 family)
MNLNPFLYYHNRIQDPKTRALTIVLTLLYLFSPIDIVPDFILGPGQVDDTILLIMFIIEIFGIAFRNNKNKATKQAGDSSVVDVEYTKNENGN